MPRFVRCPEGHVFDVEGSNQCPVCGALVGPGAAAQSDAAAATDATRATIPTGAGGKGSRNIVAIAGVGLAVAGVIGYIALHGRSAPPTTSSPASEEASPSAAAPGPPADQPERARPQPPREPPAPVTSPSRPLERVDNALPAAPERPTESSPARPSLPQNEQAAINAGYQALLERLVKDRDLAPIPGSAARFGTNPDARLAPPTTAAPSAPVAAAAAQGRWSNDAIATAEDLRARGENSQGRLGPGTAMMENGMWLGSPLSIGLLGNAHSQGLAGFPRDRQTGLALLRLGADRGDGWAAARLTDAYSRGEGVSKDFAEARRYFLLAFEREDSEPANLVSLAQKGQRGALSLLAQMGISLRELPVSSSNLYRGRAQRGLAATAIELLDRAGRSDPIAMYGLVLMAEKDEAISLSPKARLTLTREAARRGHAGAMNHLGEILLNGPAELQNPAEAALWFFSAFRFGYPAPSDKVPKDNYTAAIGRMTPEQIRAFVALFEPVARDSRAGRAQPRPR